MKAGGPPAPTAFDAHAASYAYDLGRGLSMAREDTAYYAEYRMRWLAHRSAGRGAGAPAPALDSGCGDGTSAPLLRRFLGAEAAVGLDVSTALLDVAQERHREPGIRIPTLAHFPPDDRGDLAFTNGGFHHISPAEREVALEFVSSSLRPSGHFPFWENNPWNPVTVAIMRRIPFDRDPIEISPIEARRLLAGAGFEVH